MNNCTFVGRLVRDPEGKKVNDKTVANFTIAVDNPYRDDADFIPIQVWGKPAENCVEYLGKGSMVSVVGRLQIRSYEDKQGVKRKVAEIVANDVRFLSRASTSASTDTKYYPDEESPF